MIPKIIHYVWLGSNKKPDFFYRCLESWKKFCPDYEIKEWNEKNFDFSVSPYATEAYNMKKYGFVPDYIRAKLLNEYGGFYLDTDVELTKSLDDLLDNQFVISFENGAYCETAVLGSVPNHPFSQIMCDFYLNHHYVDKRGKIDFTPSTPIWTNFLRKYFGLKMKNKTQLLTMKNKPETSVTVFNNQYFSPLNYTTKKLKVTQNTYAIHYFNATWFTGKLKTQEKILRALYYCVTPLVFNMFARIYTLHVAKKVNRIDKTIKHKFK